MMASNGLEDTSSQGYHLKKLASDDLHELKSQSGRSFGPFQRDTQENIAKTTLLTGTKSTPRTPNAQFIERKYMSGSLTTRRYMAN